MALPPELIERILLNCDGKSLLNARSVCDEWKIIVDYLAQKTSIWKWCCHEEIPPKELVQYLEQYNSEDSNVWYFVYKNWVTWQNCSEISLEIILSPAEIPRISCIDVFENYIAVGSEDGRVRIFDQYWRPLNMTRHQAEKVSKVKFFYNTKKPVPALKIVIAYPRALIIDDLFGDGYNHLIIEDVRAHSVYRDHICCQKQGGRITIEKLTSRQSENGRLLKEIWFSRVYSPDNITCMKMWNGTCSILVSNNVRKIDYYSKNILPISSFPEKCMVSFSSLPNSVTSQQIHYLLRDDIIIVLYRAEKLSDKEYIEVIMLEGGPKYVKKLFDTTDVLGATITCICLYGNTLVLGVDTGIVYFYHVPSWKRFCIKKYEQKILVGKHPITNIVVKETKDKRMFYVTSSFNIHEIVGFSFDF